MFLRNLQAGDENSSEYLFCPEIQCLAGPYMPHKREDLVAHLQRIMGDTSWLILDKNTNVVLRDIGIHSLDVKKQVRWHGILIQNIGVMDMVQRLEGLFNKILRI